ncbi:MAG: EthD family reductase [Candidatus Sulfotelmatobacter sp.]
MQRVTVVYPNKTDAKFDFDYYMTKHIPFVAGLVGKSIEIRRGISTATGSPAAFVCMATIPIDSVAAFQAIFAQHGAEILADIPNYTNIEPIVQFDEILP